MSLTSLDNALAALVQGVVNTLNISDNTALAAQHAYVFGPRVNAALAYPVATIQPTNATVVGAPGYTETCALDIAPGVGASPSAGNGLAWIDIVSNEVLSQPPTLNANTLRLGIQGTVATPTFGEVSTRKYGTNGSVPLYIASTYPGTGNPQIYLSPMDATNPNVLLGFDGSDVFVGPSTQKAAAAVRGGFLYMNTTNGIPTGVPAQVTAAWVAMTINPTNPPSLNMYVNGLGWFHTTLVAGAA